MYPYKRSHAPGLWLVAPSPGDLGPDLVVEGEDVIDRLLVLDLAPRHVVLGGVEVVGALRSQALE